jgi:progesterone-induced-blocking factor 1
VQSLADRQEVLLQEQQNENRELKRTRDDFFNRFMQSSENRRAEFGDLIKTEVARISERSRSDVEYIRDISEKVREREYRILSQSRETAMEENKQIRLDLRKADEERAKLQAEYQTLHLAHEAELMRIQSDVRVKSFELERVKLAFDELKVSYEDQSDEREALSAKFDIVRAEVIKLEHEVRSRDQQIQILGDRLAVYERLENELDMAIETLDLNSAGPLAIPSDANRRVRQSVMLARRVMQLTAANNQLAATCEAMKQELCNAHQAMTEMRARLEASSQPQQVFVGMLGEKQLEIQALKTKLASLQEINRELVHEKESLQQDMRVVARQGSDIAQMRAFTRCSVASDFDAPTKAAVDPAPFIITRRD